MMLTPLLFGLAAQSTIPTACDSFTPSSAVVTSARAHRGRFAALDRRDGGELLTIRSTRRLLLLRRLLPPRSRRGSSDDDDDDVDDDDGRKRRRSAALIAIDEFVSTVRSSLDDGTFVSFVLRDVPNSRGKRSKKTTNDEERLRGRYKSVAGRLVLMKEKEKGGGRGRRGGRGEGKSSMADEDGGGGVPFVQATIKYHLATDVAKNWRVWPRGGQRPPGNSEVDEVVGGLRRLFSTATGNAEYDDDDAVPSSSFVAGDIGIRSGEIVTADGAYELRIRTSDDAVFRRLPPSDDDAGSHARRGAVAREDSRAHDGTYANRPLSHDRPRNVPIPPTSTFLRRLGLSNADGRPANGMSSKLRQCQKFVEVVGKLVDDCSISSATHTKIRVIDMGCGRGYLTFSLHSYLCDKFSGGGGDGGGGGVGIAVETRGIDRRPKLVEEINGIAAELGGEFVTLGFFEGTIGNAALGGGPFWNDDYDDDGRNGDGGNDDGESTLDVIIALHACDTATDDALHFAVDRDADVIVVAPCCQYELRPQIDAVVGAGDRHPLEDVLRHAIYRERATETVTDAMRALLLEIAGYDTRVFEFVGGEHTAKNVMIAATKRRRHDGPDSLRVRRENLANLARFYGIRRQRLATLMGESVTGVGHDVEKNVNRNRSGMAPL
ncbi:hypothetical protein ACHAW5_004687 [Stephanodiscus triporus]|uniref:Methyltransferase domain-containing protein n=1 Tax=Stephanodiscus triporus TaxID=2934178 RepID=A0ABD3P647_9STRA